MTKAQKLGIKKFPYIEYNSFNNIIYFEGKHGDWYKYDYNSFGDEIYHENSYGYGWFLVYDINNEVIEQIFDNFKEPYIRYKRNIILDNILYD